MTLPASLQNSPSIDQWIAFSAEGVVEVQSGRVELGQGIETAFMQIAADELDVGMAQISLVAGDTRSGPDEGFTSGSRSIEVGGLSIRLAVSAARHLMLSHAAQLLQASVADLSVEQGKIYRGGEPTDLDWWKLAKQVDLSSLVADFAHAKSAEERSICGQSIRRTDLLEKLTGGGFLHDLVMDGMLHGRVLHPPSRQARLVGLAEDAIAARKNIVAVVRNGSFFGVLAEREEMAVAAIKAAELSATWQQSDEATNDPMAALASAEEQPQQCFDQGNVDEVAGQRFATLVQRPYVAHASIGTCCAIALWRADKTKLTVWSHSQGVFPLRGALAMALKLSETKIEVIHAAGAGCYGHNGADDVALDAALLAKAVPGKPVRLLWSRADELASSPLGTGAISQARAVVGDDGQISSFEVAVTSQPFGQRPGRGGFSNLLAAEYIDGAAPLPPANDIAGAAERNAIVYYDIANKRTNKRIVQSLPYRTSSIRGLGAFINIFAIETLMDDMARELGRDAVQFRLDHLADPRASAVIERVAQMAGWPGESVEGQGFGIAFARYKNTGAYCAVAAKISADADIVVNDLWACVDVGEVINPSGVINQIEGGMIQATSWTLKEAVSFKDGAISSRDWQSYPILKFSEIPQTDVIILEHPNSPPLGVAEAAQGPTAAAIGNAVQNALSLRVCHLPINRETITAALSTTNPM